MKPYRLIPLFCLLTVLALPCHGTVLLDDTWADGTRTNQNLPVESAWYSSSASALTAATNSMTLTVGANAVMAITYFGTNDTSPVQLNNVGDTFTASFTLMFSNVAPANTSAGFRLMLGDFADSTLSPKGVSADGFSSSSQGAGVQGYAIFQNMGATFGAVGPTTLRKRTTLADSSLLGTTGDWTVIGSGPVASNNFPGFVDGTQYLLQVILQRYATNFMAISVAWTNLANGGFIYTGNFLDTSATNFNFDGIALRPQQASQAASNIIFLETKIELALAPTPPAITTQPTNQTTTEGQDAAFSIAASGAAPLTYQWYFNTNTPLANATNSSIIISNAQLADAGGYSVIVTNSLGAATSSVAILNVNPPPPSIVTQPEDQSVLAGQSASFSVTTTGDPPLSYQWYFNTNGLVANATNATLTFPTAQAANAGAYSVVVTNGFGRATSDVAILTVNLPSSGTLPNFDLVGFATLDGFNSFGYNQRQVGGVSGGAGGVHVQVWTVTNLVNNLQSNATLMVEVMTNLDLSVLANNSGGFPAGYPTGEILVHSNKTIYSQNGSTLSRGTLRLGKPSLGPQGNVIVRNLRFRDLWVFDPSGNYDTYGWDYVHLEQGSHHVWVDHCDFEQVYDGMLDLSHGSDYLTASWNVFRYQKKCCLIGSSDNNQAEDTNHFNVTFHHNYFMNVAERMPRMRFGNAHVFNIYVDNLGAYTPTNNEASAKAIQSTCGAATLVENVYFYHPQNGTFPTIEANGGPTGTVKVVNSTIQNLSGVSVAFRQFGQTNFAFNYPFATNQPPYPYTLDDAANVPYLVTNYAGVGKLGPLIVTQPQNQTVASGQNASFVVGSMGASPLAYQWFFTTSNVPIPAGTNAVLTVSNVQPANTGTYRVVLSNLFGSVTSSVAVLAIGQTTPISAISSQVTNGVFHALFSGASNQLYFVDRSSNVLGPWESGFTNVTSDSSGHFHIFDPVSPALSARFYRARYP